MTSQELNAIAHELNFWRGFVKTDRFLKGWLSDKKTPELQQVVYDFITARPDASVLDVGSGVVSILTGTAKKLTAVDPLGELYGFVFDYHKHRAQQPIAIPAESLSYPTQFDIVHISNAIDHTQNPFEAFNKLFECVKPGGHLIIQSFENEALFENWQGFHQFNITMDKNVIYVEDKWGEMQILHGKGYFDIVHTEKFTFEKKTWFVWICKKA